MIKSAVFLSCFYSLVFAQTLTITSATGLIPDLLGLPSSVSRLEANRVIANDQPEKFVFVEIYLDVAWEDASDLRFTMDEVSVTNGTQVWKPVALATIDGRMKSNMRSPLKQKVSIRKNNQLSETEKQSARFCAVFYNLPAGELTVQVKEATAVFTSEAGQLEEKHLPKIKVLESTLHKEFVKEAPKTIPLVPNVQEKIVPLTGEILSLKLQVLSQDPNSIGGDAQYLFKPSDFSLVSGNQYIPFHTLVGRSNLMDDSIFTLSTIPSPQDFQEQNEKGVTLEILFLVDPADTTWDLYFGKVKIDTITL
ncbi:hypothetical protein P3T73_14675 [Kiritimatiellota bacterium B12222]|nr:hypothetical protein P3T73_14675 [Kiritimatiellota bacterium B12222]